MNSPSRPEPILHEAAERLDCSPKDLRYFCETDPFNQGQQVEGAICLIHDHRYGNLFIARVNNKYKPQVIYATPRIKYPFVTHPDGRRSCHFPDCRKVQFRTKADGTNIMAVRYTDGHAEFISYKTRLTPFLRADSTFGNWIRLWQIMLEKYPDIPKLVKELQMNISFEMYGTMNPHLVTYHHDLDLAMLFRRDDQGRIFGPLDTECKIPSATLVATCAPSEVQSVYETWRERLNNENKASVANMQGYCHEGLVLNCITNTSEMTMLKLKPELIESIHFAAGGGLSKEIVKATCFKVLENALPLTIENVKSELEMDYRPVIVDSFEPEILTVMQGVEQDCQFRQQVQHVYQEIGLSVTTHKAEVMRAMSQHFSKEQMKRVYQIIQNT